MPGCHIIMSAHVEIDALGYSSIHPALSGRFQLFIRQSVLDFLFWQPSPCTALCIHGKSAILNWDLIFFFQSAGLLLYQTPPSRDFAPKNSDLDTVNMRSGAKCDFSVHGGAVVARQIWCNTEKLWAVSMATPKRTQVAIYQIAR